MYSTVSTLLKSSTLPLTAVPLTLHTPQPTGDFVCGSPRLSSSFHPPIRESISCGELSYEIPMIQSASKMEDYSPREIPYNDTAEDNEPDLDNNTMDTICGGLVEIRQQVAEEIMDGIRECTKQLWFMHDHLVEKLQKNIGEVIELLASTHTNNLMDYCNRFVLQSKLNMQDVGGEVCSMHMVHF